MKPVRYFYDFEFYEGFTKPLIGRPRHFIDLISVGIVAEDGREYYAVSKEFDLKRAWKDEWLRENVLQPLYNDLYRKENNFTKTYYHDLIEPFCYRTLKNFIKWHGKTRKQIADEIREFVYHPVIAGATGVMTLDQGLENWLLHNHLEFYGYYADYDHVLLSSLFGRMIDLPKGFPMYTRDIKQMLDEKVLSVDTEAFKKLYEKWNEPSFEKWKREKENYKNTFVDLPAAVEEINERDAQGRKCFFLSDFRHRLILYKHRADYPKQKEPEHHALYDARFEKQLFDFLINDND